MGPAVQDQTAAVHHAAHQPHRRRLPAAAGAAVPHRVPLQRKQLGAGRAFLPRRHGDVLRQHVRVGAVSGAGGSGPIRRFGTPVRGQGPAHPADVSVHDGGGVGGGAGRHAAPAGVATDLHAGRAADHHLPRRAARGGAGELLPAVFCHLVHFVLPVALPGHAVLPRRRAAHPAGRREALWSRRPGDGAGAGGVHRVSAAQQHPPPPHLRRQLAGRRRRGPLRALHG